MEQAPIRKRNHNLDAPLLSEPIPRASRCVGALITVCSLIGLSITMLSSRYGLLHRFVIREPGITMKDKPMGGRSGGGKSVSRKATKAAKNVASVEGNRDSEPGRAKNKASKAAKYSEADVDDELINTKKKPNKEAKPGAGDGEEDDDRGNAKKGGRKGAAAVARVDDRGDHETAGLNKGSAKVVANMDHAQAAPLPQAGKDYKNILDGTTEVNRKKLNPKSTVRQTTAALPKARHGRIIDGDANQGGLKKGVSAAAKSQSDDDDADEIDDDDDDGDEKMIVSNKGESVSSKARARSATLSARAEPSAASEDREGIEDGGHSQTINPQRHGLTSRKVRVAPARGNAKLAQVTRDHDNAESGDDLDDDDDAGDDADHGKICCRKKPSPASAKLSAAPNNDDDDDDDSEDSDDNKDKVGKDRRHHASDESEDSRHDKMQTGDLRKLVSRARGSRVAVLTRRPVKEERKDGTTEDREDGSRPMKDVAKQRDLVDSPPRVSPTPFKNKLRGVEEKSDDGDDGGLDLEDKVLEEIKKKKKQLADLNRKIYDGGKLSSKEKRQLKRLEAAQKTWPEDDLTSEEEESPTSDNVGFDSSALGAQFSASVRLGGDVTQAATMSGGIMIPEFSIQAAAVDLLVDAELKLLKGRRYGVMAPNGKGKTTLLKHIAHKALPGLPTTLDVLYVEQEVQASTDRTAVQELLASDKKQAKLLAEEARLNEELEKATVAEVNAADEAARAAASAKTVQCSEQLIALFDELEANNVDASEARARKLLLGLGFDDAKQDAPTKSFSGGWRMRLALARALFMNPEFLLLDEPTNHLDLDAVIWLQNYLATEAKKSTMLLVSHDQDFLNHVCTDIITIQSKKLHYFAGDYDEYKKQAMSSAEADRKKKLQEQKELAKLKESLDRIKIPQKKQQAKDRIEELKANLAGREGEYRVTFDLPSSDNTFYPPLVSMRNVGFSYTDNGPQIFTNVNFTLDMGTRVAIVGPNGCGKSTFLSLLAGDMLPTSGQHKQSSKSLRIGFYAQHLLEILPPDFTPVQYLGKVKRVDVAHGSKGYQEARMQLGKKGLPRFAHELKMRDLSGGQKARVVFAAISAMRPHVLLLDEPTNHLDIESVDALIDAVKEFDGGVVVISHDRRFLQECNCKLWMCKAGEKGIVPLGEGYSFDDYAQTVLDQIEEKRSDREQLIAERARKRLLRKEAAMKEAEKRKPRKGAGTSSRHT